MYYLQVYLYTYLLFSRFISATILPVLLYYDIIILQKCCVTFFLHSSWFCRCKSYYCPFMLCSPPPYVFYIFVFSNLLLLFSNFYPYHPCELMNMLCEDKSIWNLNLWAFTSIQNRLNKVWSHKYYKELCVKADDCWLCGFFLALAFWFVWLFRFFSLNLQDRQLARLTQNWPHSERWPRISAPSFY